MTARTLRLVSCLGLALLAGCAAKGEVVTLNIQTVPPNAGAAAKKGDVHVIVMPFEDLRGDQSRLGARSHFWGGKSYFDVPGGKPVEAAAEAVTNYLNAKGWHAELAKSQVRGASVEKSEILLSGKVLALSVDAESKFLKTTITAKSKIAVQGQNTADGSVVRMTLNGAGSQSVFWFEPEDAQQLLNDVLAESLEKLVTDTKFENGLLRLK